MKIFLSWSGARSRALAETMHSWIPNVIQAARPYFAPSDNERGARWQNEIARELANSAFGMVFLTSENLNAPWVMFEAGALSHLEKGRVCPVLFGVSSAEIKGPLVQFQAVSFNQAEIFSLVASVNDILDQPLSPHVLHDVFAMWWPRLNEAVEKALALPSREASVAPRSDRDILEEVLALTRERSHPQFSRTTRLAAERLAEAYFQASASAVGGKTGEAIDDLIALAAPLRRILDRVLSPGGTERRSILETLANAEMLLQEGVKRPR